MAIYHLSVKTISRSAGRSATAAAAYRAGVEITDERSGEVHDYRRRRGVEHAELVLPEGAPAWAGDRAALWNAAEQAETRRNSTVARELVLALPNELDADERRRLVLALAGEVVGRHRCAVDVAVHAPDRKGDERNHHAHLLLSTRRLGPEGFGEKTRELDQKQSGLVGEWRQRWEQLANRALERTGAEARIDHRSFAARGLEEEPTQHLGPTAATLEQRGVATERGEINRAVAEHNAAVVELGRTQAAVRALQAERAQDQALADPAVEKVWEAEREARAKAIMQRAARLEAKAQEVMEWQAERLAGHRHDRPQAPGKVVGWVPGVRGRYERTLEAWWRLETRLDDRYRQLRRRLERVGEWTREGLSRFSGYPSKAEQAAETQLRQERPELGRRMEQVRETQHEERRKEISEQLARQRERRERDRDQGWER